MNDDIKANSPVEEIEYSYTDLHKPILEEKEEEKIEEKVETPEEEVEEIDPKDLVEQTAKETAERILESQRKEEEERLADLEKKQQEEALANRNPAQEYLERVKAEGKEPTWEDAFKTIREDAVKEALEALERRQEEVKKLEESRIAESKRIEEEQIKKYNETVDLQLKELYDDGKLTPIKDQNNPSDQGVVERKALFMAMQETNNKRISEGKPPVYSIKEIYAFHYTKPNAKPAGEDAPVSMGNGASTPDDGQELDYREIHKKPFSFFRR